MTANEAPLPRGRRTHRLRQDDARAAAGGAHRRGDALRGSEGESVPAALLSRHAALRAADAALLPFPARGPARVAEAAGPLREADDRRFLARQGSALRAA